MLKDAFKDYRSRLVDAMNSFDLSLVFKLAEEVLSARQENKHIFLCGNGGSAANAIHIANDFVCLISRSNKKGIRATALSSNQAVFTCLGNDIGYENIFSFQLETLGKEGDILIALSGSGNSPNILKAVHTAKDLKIRSYAILGFDGGKCLNLVDVPIHFSVNDMQISEDLQLIVGHMVMQNLIKQISGEQDARKNRCHR